MNPCPLCDLNNKYSILVMDTMEEYASVHIGDNKFRVSYNVVYRCPNCGERFSEMIVETEERRLQ